MAKPKPNKNATPKGERRMRRKLSGPKVYCKHCTKSIPRNRQPQFCNAKCKAAYTF